MRVAMGIEYDGTSFHGWQRQKEGIVTVQDRLEYAISKVADHPVTVACAGRTDTGVHALGQVVHFDTPSNRSSRGWLLGSNVNLPPDISVTWVKQVPEHFHARFSAVNRRYRYIIMNRNSRSAIWRDRTVWQHHPLDAERMDEAALSLLGTHDFSSFRALGCQAKSPVKTIIRLDASRQEDRVIIDVKANAFLHHMVRNIAGVLIAIGKGDRPVVWAKEVLEYRSRVLGGVTAPPQGLYMMEVGYPGEFALPEPPAD
ncbi:tRNA pseudouridine(38-40) synthase TruA [Candidatus Vondammii sp. HM_W22]|uniref:tRNA pseudouridine(38-40) synthase TruA n=1 Tax=Candidatus Vondammii sp. HM_W22 TaxID=2687299 RepID=UPI001F14340A|nr:tRNA pseudouridine(38-40) synthase TruA [Candidatus Vondammii sp. HM_W22]